MAEVVGQPRRYWRDGNLYVIRDVWKSRSWRQRLGLVRCEYAVRNPNGSKKWKPCIEGVEFAAIEPLRHRAHG
jgi:hypothetical protein